MKDSHPNAEKYFIVLHGLLDQDFTFPALLSVCDIWKETHNEAKETPTRLGINTFRETPVLRVFFKLMEMELQVWLYPTISFFCGHPRYGTEKYNYVAS